MGRIVIDFKIVLLLLHRSVDLNFLPSVDPETVLQTGMMNNVIICSKKPIGLVDL